MNVSIPNATRRKPGPRHNNPTKARNIPGTMIRAVTPTGMSQKKLSPSRMKRSPVNRCLRINRPRSEKPLTKPIHKAINNKFIDGRHATHEPFPILLISSGTCAGSFGLIRNLIPILMNPDDFARAPASPLQYRYRRNVVKGMSPKKRACLLRSLPRHQPRYRRRSTCHPLSQGAGRRSCIVTPLGDLRRSRSADRYGVTLKQCGIWRDLR